MTWRNFTGISRSVAQSCLTLCDFMGCSPPGSSVHGILQARILEWAAMPSSRGSSWRRDRTCTSCIVGGFIYHWAFWRAVHRHSVEQKKLDPKKNEWKKERKEDGRKETKKKRNKEEKKNSVWFHVYEVWHQGILWWWSQNTTRVEPLP